MSTFRQLQEGMDRAWESLQSGWRALTQRASHALTRFLPGERDQDDEESLALYAASPGWGLVAAELRESEDEVCARIEMPGLEPENISIAVEQGVLVVTGEKRVVREERRGRYHLTERAYGRFERALPLPTEVDESGATADYRRGVLTVRLPKHPRVTARRIPVRGG